MKTAAMYFAQPASMLHNWDMTMEREVNDKHAMP